MNTSTECEEPRREPQFRSPTDDLPDWLKLPRRRLGLVCAVAAVFWYLTMLPLWHTDLWLNLKYGEWIAGHLQVPRFEQFMPLSAGIPYVDDAWLSQLLLLAAFKAAGFDGLSLLYAATLTTIVVLLLAAAIRSTGRAWLGGLCLVLLLPILWPSFMAFRPQLFGAVMFTGLLHVVLARAWHRANWWLIPIGFIAWANLHSSFALGLVVLVCCIAGRASDAWGRERRIEAVLNDVDTRRWILVTQLAFSASLVNPYGLELYRAVLESGSSPNLRDIVEWQPLSMRSWDGVGMAMSLVPLVVLLRWSRRAVPATEALLMFVFGLTSLPHTRYTQWWGLLMPFMLVPHAASVLDQWRGSVQPARVRHFKYSVLAVALSWIFFAYSGAGHAILHRQPRTLEAVVSRFTPLATAEYLKQHPPRGQVFHPIEWGDWLAWYGPPGIQCLATSQVQLVPSEIWTAYQRVVETRSGWETTLDGLGVTTLVIDKERQAVLWNEIRSSAHWRIVHEDRLGVVAEHTHSPARPAESVESCGEAAAAAPIRSAVLAERPRATEESW